MTSTRTPAALVLASCAAIATIAVLAALPATPAGAHHSFAAVYRADETVQIEGKVVQFLDRKSVV